MTGIWEQMANAVGFQTHPRTQHEVQERAENERIEAIRKWEAGIKDAEQQIQDHTQALVDLRKYLIKANYHKSKLEVMGFRNGTVDKEHVTKIVDNTMIDGAKLASAVKIGQSRDRYEPEYKTSKAQAKQAVREKEPAFKIETVDLA